MFLPASDFGQGRSCLNRMNSTSLWPLPNLACWLRATFQWTALNHEGTNLVRFCSDLDGFSSFLMIFFFWKFSIYPSITSGSDIVFSEIWLWKYEFRFPKRCILAPNTVLISFLVLIFENFILRNRFRKRWYIDRDIDQYFEGPTKKLTSEFYENADLSLLEVRNGQKFKSLDSIEFLQS